MAEENYEENNNLNVQPLPISKPEWKYWFLFEFCVIVGVVGFIVNWRIYFWFLSSGAIVSAGVFAGILAKKGEFKKYPYPALATLFLTSAIVMVILHIHYYNIFWLYGAGVLAAIGLVYLFICLIRVIRKYHISSYLVLFAVYGLGVASLIFLSTWYIKINYFIGAGLAVLYLIFSIVGCFAGPKKIRVAMVVSTCLAIGLILLFVALLLAVMVIAPAISY